MTARENLEQAARLIGEAQECLVRAGFGRSSTYANLCRSRRTMEDRLKRTFEPPAPNALPAPLRFEPLVP